MTVFISYSQRDHDFVDRLCLRLLEENVKVWRDRFQLSPGDALTERIQGAIERASFLCVVVSRSSVVSEWVEREIEAGLLQLAKREDLRIIPLLLDETPVPPGLADQLWIDSRGDPSRGIERLVEMVRGRYAIEGWSGSTQGEKYLTYFTTEGGWVDDRYDLLVEVVSVDREEDFCILTQVRFRGNETATEAREGEHGIESYKRFIIAACARDFEAEASRVTVSSSSPARSVFRIEDGGTLAFEARVQIKVIGDDGGRSTLFNFGGLFAQIASALDIDPDESTRARPPVGNTSEG